MNHSMSGDQILFFKFIRDDDNLEMAFWTRGNIVHVTLVDNLKICRLERMTGDNLL